MKRALAVMLMVAAMASVAQASLITNGGNDDALVDSEIPGWTEVVGSTWTQRSASPSPQAGGYYFNPGAGASHELAQTVDVSAYSAPIDAGLQRFDFSGYVSGWKDPGDTSRIVLEFEDASAVVLGSWDSGAIYNPYDEDPTWQQLTHSQFAPAGTRQIQIRLIAVRNAGTNNDGYFDSLELDAIQTPIAARVDVEGRTSNPPSSVTILNQTTGANLWVSGDNRGDFALGYPGSTTPILQSNGVVIANCNELVTSGSRGSVAVTGELTGNVPGNSKNGGMWIASFTSDGGGEANYDFSFGWFPYALGWIGGHINAAGTGFEGSGNLPAGSTVSVASSTDFSGEFLLTLDGIDPRTDGMLFVVDGRNDNNIAVAGVPDDDTIEGGDSWHIAAFDESDNFDTYEQGHVSFLYVPYSTEGLCGGWIGTNGTKKASRGQFSVNHTAAGKYELVIPDDAGGRYDDSDGILLLTVARLLEIGEPGVDGNPGGLAGVEDNAIAWAYDATADDGDGAFVLQSHDLASWTFAQDTEFVFAFVLYDGILDVPGPPQGTMIAIY
ncbi:MAG: hypothetical protein ISS31_07490 [Kiritimatiellae bacterium]|nr:hypothetical protein [Kiritimatiellia bacterium]